MKKTANSNVKVANTSSLQFKKSAIAIGVYSFFCVSAAVAQTVSFEDSGNNLSNNQTISNSTALIVDFYIPNNVPNQITETVSDNDQSDESEASANKTVTYSRSANSNTLTNSGSIDNSLSYGAMNVVNAENVILNVSSVSNSITADSASSAATSVGVLTHVVESTNNIITNSGVLLGNEPLSITAFGDGTVNTSAAATSDYYYSGASSSIASSTVTVNSLVAQNTIVNSGTITANDGAGVLLQAFSAAEAIATSSKSYYDYDADGIGGDGQDLTNTRGGNGSANASSIATAKVNLNTVTNSGDINSNDSGLVLFSEAVARSTSNSSYDVSFTTTEIVGNNITNSGTIIAGEHGIDLETNHLNYGGEDVGYWENTSQISKIDGNRITNSGIIDSYNNAIYIHGGPNDNSNLSISNNQILNSGSLFSEAGYGINISGNTDDDSVTNISNNTILNSGLISTEYTAIRLNAETDDDGTSTLAHNTITNTGRIFVRDGGGIKLEVDVEDDSSGYLSNNTIVNSGLIQAYGENLDDLIDGYGIRVGAYGGEYSSVSVTGNIITNTGKIYSNEGGIFIYADNDGGEDSSSSIIGNQINNIYGGRIVSGLQNGGAAIEIRATGENTTVSSNTVNISGLVVADPGVTFSDGKVIKSAGSIGDLNNSVALKITSEDQTNTNPSNTVTISAPAYLAGKIQLGVETNTTLNLVSGPSHSVRWEIESNSTYSPTTVNHTGSVPWFINDGANTSVYATVDPSALAAAPNQLADLTAAASSLSRIGMNSPTEKGSGLWVAVQGGAMNYDGNGISTLKQRTDHSAVAIGYNGMLGETRISTYLGMNEAKLRVASLYSDVYANSYDNKASGVFLGVRGLQNLGSVQLDMGLTIGRQDHDDIRFVNDNYLWWGKSFARSSYSSNLISPDIGLAIPLTVGTWTVTPNIRTSYSLQKVDGYTETGTASNATYDKRSVGVTQTSAGLDLIKNLGSSKLLFSAGYMYRSLSGDETVRVTMIGDTKNLNYDYKNFGAGYARLGFTSPLSKAVDLTGSASYFKGGSSQGTVGQLGMRVKF